jgi:hypothetical protein
MKTRPLLDHVAVNFFKNTLPYKSKRLDDLFLFSWAIEQEN